MPVPEFDQFVEYVIEGVEGPEVHAVALDQHALEAVETVEAVQTGYINIRALGREILANAEIAMVFAEWTPAGGLVSLPGVVAQKVLKGWTAKSVAVAYIISDTASINAINTNRTTAVAFIRLSLNGATTPLLPREPFTAGQVTALATWINNHNITNAEFAALFGVSAAQLSAWLQNHPRWQFAQQLHDRFT